MVKVLSKVGKLEALPDKIIYTVTEQVKG